MRDSFSGRGGSVAVLSGSLTMIDCAVRDSTGQGGGGGIRGGTAVDCLIEGNSTSDEFGVFGGGAAFAVLTRCIVRGNIAGIGGGVYGCTLDRCKVAHSLAAGLFGEFGGGGANSSLKNSVVWGYAPDQVTGGSVADMGAIPFEPLHRREDATFCAGSQPLEIKGTLSLRGGVDALVLP